MNLKIVTTSALFVSIVLFGCAGPEGRVHTALYDTAVRTPTTQVDVFQPGQKPAKPYRVIALFTADGSAHEEAECMEGMLMRCRHIGADGIILSEPEAPNKNIAFTGIIGPSPEYRIFKANAFAYDK